MLVVAFIYYYAVCHNAGCIFIVMLSVNMLVVTFFYAECYYAEGHSESYYTTVS
jgi:hypothetical protein